MCGKNISDRRKGIRCFSKRLGFIVEGIGSCFGGRGGISCVDGRIVSGRH